MAESGGLENRWTCKRPVGSNPTPSAIFYIVISIYYKIKPLFHKNT